MTRYNYNTIVITEYQNTERIYLTSTISRYRSSRVIAKRGDFFAVGTESRAAIS